MSDFPDDRTDADRSTPSTAADEDAGDPASADDGAMDEGATAGGRVSTADASRTVAERDPEAGAGDGAGPDPAQDFESRGSGMRGRDVEVPMRVYKAVTVFSTLIAVVCVVGGFVVLDRATARAQLPLAEVDHVLALVGIGTILFGAAIYAFGTRFHAAGMGSSKNDDDEAADNG